MKPRTRSLARGQPPEIVLVAQVPHGRLADRRLQPRGFGGGQHGEGPEVLEILELGPVVLIACLLQCSKTLGMGLESLGQLPDLFRHPRAGGVAGVNARVQLEGDCRNAVLHVDVTSDHRGHAPMVKHYGWWVFLERVQELGGHVRLLEELCESRNSIAYPIQP